MNKQNIYLGIDASTSSTGICLLDKEKQIIELFAIDLSKISALVDKANLVESKLKEIQQKYSDYNFLILLEEPASAYAIGKSSARTLQILNQFSGCVQFIVSRLFQRHAVLLSPHEIRKSNFVKLLKPKTFGITTKEQLLAEFKRIHPMFPIPMKTLKSGPRRGLQLTCESFYDQVDAYFCAKTILILNSSTNTKV